MPTTRDVLLALFDAHGVAPEPGPEAQREAAAWAADPKIDDPRLDDLTRFAFVTLDGRHARDLDQALHVERRGRGHRVRYAIADASFYVRPGSELWAEALHRGSSYYLPGLAAPMLPRVLSEDVVSLNPDVDRRAVVFVHDLDEEGVCTRTEIVRGRIRSRAKLGFAETQVFLDGGAAPRGMDAVAASLACLREVGTRRMRLADERGVVRFRRAEVKIVADGPAFTAVEAVEYACENYNEQLSLLCNVEGAKVLRRGAPEGVLQPIYRVHAAPTESALGAFCRLVDALRRLHGRDETWRWRRDVPLAHYLASLPRDGDDGRLAATIHRQALLVGGRAEYVGEPGLHYGIGADAYARFSAPMREIVGVFCHDELMEALAGRERVLPGAEPDEVLRTQVIAAADRSRTTQKKLERSANRLVIDRLLAGDMEHPEASRPVRSGVLMGLGRGKVHVRLDGPPIDLKVYVKHLEGDLKIDRDRVRLLDGKRAFLGVGARVEIMAAGRDVRTERWRLRCRPASRNLRPPTS